MQIFINFMKDNLSKKEGKDQESIQSSTTPDPGFQWESDNNNDADILLISYMVF